MKIKYLSIIVVTSVLYGCSSQPATVTAPPPTLPVMILEASAVTTYQQYPASVEGTSNVEIRPQVTGTLKEIFIDEGALVSAGQPIFKIDPQPYQAALDNAVATLHAAESASINANLEVEKLSPLVANKVVSEYQLKTAKAAAGVANANIEQAKASVSAAKINLGYTLIKAPENGYIGRLLKKKGSLVAPSDPTSLTDISNVSNVHVYFSLSEQDFTDFKSQYPGATLAEKLKNLPNVTLILSDNSEYPQRGRIDIIDGKFNSNTGAITLRANFPNAHGLLRSGNTGKIKLGLVHHDIFLIPQSATVQLQDKTFLFALADSNKVKKQEITLSGASGTDYVVTSGVKPGERIITDGIIGIKEGEIITPETSSKVAPIKK